MCVGVFVSAVCVFYVVFNLVFLFGPRVAVVKGNRAASKIPYIKLNVLNVAPEARHDAHDNISMLLPQLFPTPVTGTPSP